MLHQIHRTQCELCGCVAGGNYAGQGSVESVLLTVA